MNNPSTLLIPVALFVAAILVLIYIWYRNRRFLAESLPAKGIVIGLHKSAGKSGPVYAPIVRFILSDGRIVEFTDSISSSPARFKVGDKVDILYHHQRNSWARVPSSNPGSDLWDMFTSGPVMALLVLVCLFMAVMGIVAFFVRSSKM